MTFRTLLSSAAILAVAGYALPAAAQDGPVKACLITKTDINPFFVKMKEGATAKAQELYIALSAVD